VKNTTKFLTILSITRWPIYLSISAPRAQRSTILTTRPGEGFQQEVQQAYDQTDFRDDEPQMVRIDENQEAIARIRMSVDIFDSARAAEISQQNDNDGEAPPDTIVEGSHWKLGARLRLTTEISNLAFRHFEKNFLAFLKEHIPGEECHQPVTIYPYQCLYLRYRSLEDWVEKQDILRCNPKIYVSLLTPIPFRLEE